jgi:hypothetical protein
VNVDLVRHGADWRWPRHKSGVAMHTALPVYGEMLLQICMTYPGLPDPRTLSLCEIRFFYNGMRAQLRAATKPRET